jgi:hypothetical protein
MLERALQAQLKMLQEFGYPSLTLPTLETAHANWKAGKKAEGVIEMMAFRDYDERPELFGEKA